MDATLAPAVEALRVAGHLLDQYRRDASGLVGPRMHVEGQLLALDQNHAGLWDQLDRASTLLAAAGRDVAAFVALRGILDDPHAGYDVERKLTISLDGVSEEVRFRINKQRLELARRALQVLQALLPEVDWRAGDETDAEVARFLAGERGGKTALRLLAWLAGIVLLVGGAIGLFVWLRPIDYGPQTGRLRALEHELEARPCDKRRIVELTELYNRASAFHRSLRRANAFFERCGDYDRLRWVTYSSCKYAGEHACAIAEAGKLIARHPHDKDYRWWRGEIYERQGDLPRAIADYRQALALQPALRSIPLRLARLLERGGRPCEAIRPLAQLLLWGSTAGASQLARQVDALRERPACRGWAGRGSVELVLPAQGGAHRAMVRIGDATGRFVVDQRAGLVLLRPAFAARAGLSAPAAAARLIVRTRWGHAEGPALRVDLALAEAQASRVEAVIADAGPPGDDGVLGLSFLLRFTLQEQGPVLRLRGASVPTTAPAGVGAPASGPAP